MTQPREAQAFGQTALHTTLLPVKELAMQQMQPSTGSVLMLVMLPMVLKQLAWIMVEWPFEASVTMLDGQQHLHSWGNALKYALHQCPRYGGVSPMARIRGSRDQR